MKTSRVIVAVGAVLLTFTAAKSHAIGVSGQGTWEITLLPRDLDGNPSTIEAYYDTVLGVTWAADADADGLVRNWVEATAYVAGLNINGVSGWRLPDTNPINGVAYILPGPPAFYRRDGSSDWGLNVSAPGSDFEGNTGSEMAYMFYNTLGNLSMCNPATSTATACDTQAGDGLTNTGPFADLRNQKYWSGTEYNGDAWEFNFNPGQQGDDGKANNYFVWAVRDGDIVPVPPAVWLFGSGLLGLIGIARRKKAT